MRPLLYNLNLDMATKFPFPSLFIMCMSLALFHSVIDDGPKVRRLHTLDLVVLLLVHHQ